MGHTDCDFFPFFSKIVTHLVTIFYFYVKWSQGMNLFFLVREALGLSQEALAQLLGVQISILKMAETNRRNLPPDALRRLIWLNSQVQQLSQQALPPVYQAEAISDLLRSTQKKKWELDTALESVRRKKKQMQNRLTLQPEFTQQFPPENFPSEASRINALVVQAQIFIDHEDKESELLLRARQVGLEAMIAFLKNLA
jgi:transcriptional regulator with XRE-family HTH domain